MPGAFEGVRIVDCTQGVAGPMATMILADHGADVVKVESPGGDRLQDHPGYITWSRNKRLVTIDRDSFDGQQQILDLVSRADVVIFDDPPGVIERQGLDRDTLAAAFPALLHVWLPMFGERGRWSQLPHEDPLLAAVAGGAWAQFSWEGVPVHLVSPQVAYGHAMTAATAIAAGLVERAETGAGQSLVCTGLHGFAAVQSGSALRAGEVMRMRGRGARGGVAKYRLYQCADGQWLFLGTLLEPHFLKALETLDLLGDVLTLEGVDGELANTMLPDVAPAVVELLDARFLEKPRQEWLDILHAAGVPRGPVTTRDEWFYGDQVSANDMRVTLDHPRHGPVDMPGVSVKLRGTPGDVRSFIVPATVEEVAGGWDSRPNTLAHPEPNSTGPLAGITVLDLGVIIAAPHASTVLANLGANVIKVEPLDGDSFRPFGLGFIGFNQGKRSISVDLKSPAGREVFYDLVRNADAVCDNYRLGVLDRLGIDYETLRKINPRIISCSVTGYGPAGPLAADPGFDPLMQARSGLMEWQGGDDEPVFHAIPVNDTASAIMAAFGITAAIFARKRTGEGQRVETSLTNSSVLCQSGELTRFAGVPDMPRGGRDHPGNHAVRRLYQCSDGWVHIWVTTTTQYQALCVALDHPEWTGRMTAEQAIQEPAESELATRIAEAVAALPLDEVVRRLLAAAVPAAPCTETADIFSSPWHLENHFLQDFEHPLWGPMTTARGYATYSRTPGGFPRRAPLLAEHTHEILSEIGYTPDRIAPLEEAGAIGAFQPPE